jgi:hypothetical protein
VSVKILWLTVEGVAFDGLDEIVATLYAGAAQPVSRKFPISELRDWLKARGK